MNSEQEITESASEIEQQNDAIENDLKLQAESSNEELVEENAADKEVADDQEITVSIAELSNQLEEAKQKAQQNWDKALRIQAEMENLKRRTQKDIENAHKFGLEKFTKELLTVVDSLELGIQASTGESPEVVKLREGSELTMKQFEAVFSKFDIQPIDPVGQPFDPEQHQAMSMQPSADFEPNTVMNVFQKGYTLNGRLIRPAMVVVAKAAEEAQENTPKIDEQA